MTGDGLGAGRAQMLRRLQSEEFDLLVVGGGITGAAVAREAGMRGLRVALAERSDFASGTSSRSTKLIHGGLRYLRQFEFRLVREAVRERQALLLMAPHLVTELPFLFPIFEGDREGLLLIRLGVGVYDALAESTAHTGHRMLRQGDVLELEPFVRETGLRGGALYSDCRTNDARLTLAVVESAALHGAAAANYLEVRSFQRERSGPVSGALVRDVLSGDEFQIRAGRVLAAAGPWGDAVRRLDDPDAPPILERTKGVHLTVAHDRLPILHAVVMRGPDQRILFAVPHGDHTYLGTTDTPHTGDPGEAAVAWADAEYVLRAAGRTFPDAAIGPSDVVSTWAGIRPLIRPEGRRNPSAISRDYEIFESPSGLVSVGGGKLTAFRPMAKRIVDRLFPKTSGTGRGWEPLPGTPEGNGHRLDVLALAADTGVDTEDLRTWLGPYGERDRDVASLLEEGPHADPALAWHRAMTRYAVRHEMAQKLIDVYARRTDLLLFTPGNGSGYVDALAHEMAGLLGWTHARAAAEAGECRGEIRSMLAWRADLRQ